MNIMHYNSSTRCLYARVQRNNQTLRLYAIFLAMKSLCFSSACTLYCSGQQRALFFIPFHRAHNMIRTRRSIESAAGRLFYHQ